MKIIIPARAGSKGLPHKNRLLFNATADTIPPSLKDQVWVLTDDSVVIQLAQDRGFNVWYRHAEISGDTTSTWSLMDFFILNQGIDDDLVVLYLTYPERTWDQIESAIEIYKKKKLKSLLCKKKIEITPFLILKEEEGNRGSQLFYHDLYRRQDYPTCFELSHFICIFKSKSINKLNHNLYYRDTYYLDISPDTIDVDTQKDLDKLNGGIR
jgi:CMP-N-acetylneuraminic acid synthetase